MRRPQELDRLADRPPKPCSPAPGQPRGSGQEGLACPFIKSNQHGPPAVHSFPLPQAGPAPGHTPRPRAPSPKVLLACQAPEDPVKTLQITHICLAGQRHKHRPHPRDGRDSAWGHIPAQSGGWASQDPAPAQRGIISTLWRGPSTPSPATAPRKGPDSSVRPSHQSSPHLRHQSCQSW